jgi:hypothetical protein
MTPMKVHFPPNGPLGLGLGKRRELFRPCRPSERCPAPYFWMHNLQDQIDARSLIKKRERRTEARRFRSQGDRLFALFGSRVPDHVRLSQADLLIGAFPAPKAGAARQRRDRE